MKKKAPKRIARQPIEVVVKVVHEYLPAPESEPSYQYRQSSEDYEWSSYWNDFVPKQG